MVAEERSSRAARLGVTTLPSRLEGLSSISDSAEVIALLFKNASNEKIFSLAATEGIIWTAVLPLDTLR